MPVRLRLFARSAAFHLKSQPHGLSDAKTTIAVEHAAQKGARLELKHTALFAERQWNRPRQMRRVLPPVESIVHPSDDALEMFLSSMSITIP